MSKLIIKNGKYYWAEDEYGFHKHKSGNKLYLNGQEATKEMLEWCVENDITFPMSFEHEVLFNLKWASND